MIDEKLDVSVGVLALQMEPLRPSSRQPVSSACTAGLARKKAWIEDFCPQSTPFLSVDQEMIGI
jgi:hypothetical protein